MTFKRGHKGYKYWLDKTFSEAHKQNMRKPKSTTINMKGPETEDHKSKLSKSWNYNKHVTSGRRRKTSESMKKWYRENKFSEIEKERRKNIGKSKLGIPLSKIHKQKLVKNHKGFTGKHHSEKTIQIITKKLIQRLKEGKYNLKPNQPEKLVINLIQQNNYNFVYVGDGKFWVERFNPDFINIEKKLIIEIFGDYWHNLPGYKIRDKRRLKFYKKHGYKTLIIWEHELKSINTIKDKIQEFIKDATYV